MRIDIASKQFSDREVLQNLHMQLYPRQVTALLGPSGIGKSTLLQILAGLDRDFEGKQLSLPKNIGFCFQEPRLLPWLSVLENLKLVTKQQSEIEAMLDQMGLAGQSQILCHHLSLGMARRVALARALLVHPDILLLDEPFASLDKPRARQLLTLMLASIRQQQCATVIVTHEPTEAVALSDRILILDGTPATIVRDFPIEMTEHQRHQPKVVSCVVAQLNL
jgi:ABC-type nitrate/sulfonate/bicarbonate transport system ATPase subunit